MDEWYRVYCPELGVAGGAAKLGEAIQNLYGAAEVTSFGLVRTSIKQLSLKNRGRRPTALRVVRMLERGEAQIEELFTPSENTPTL